MRCTVPSTTAPTSRSAISTPSSVGPCGPGQQGRNYPTSHNPASIPNLAVVRLGLAVLGDGHEGDLALLHHPQASPSQELQVLGVAETLDAKLERRSLLLQRVHLLLQGDDLGLLSEVLPQRDRHGGGQGHHEDGQEQGPAGQAGPRATYGGAARAQDRNLRYGADPAYRAVSPSSSSIRSRRLYFAVRSPREGAPALIWPAPVATARSAMVVSSVSPDRWETTRPKPASAAWETTSRASVSVPIWLTFTRMALQDSSSTPWARRSGFVTNRSSPTSWHRPPRASVMARQPSQSSSASGSSTDTMGNELMRPPTYPTISSASRSPPSMRYRPTSNSSLAATSRAMATSSPGSRPAASTAWIRTSHAASEPGRSGAKPPSSPTSVASPRSLSLDLRTRKHPAAHRSASENEAAP